MRNEGNDRELMTGQDRTEQLDLFEDLYPPERAAQSVCTEREREPSGEDQSLNGRRWRPLLWLSLPLLALLSFWGGYRSDPLENVCQIGKRATLYRQDGSHANVHLDALSAKKLQFSALSQGSREQKQAAHAVSQPTFQVKEISLDQVRRIDLLPKEPVKKLTEKKKSRPNNSSHKLNLAERRFLGRYRVNVTDHKAILHVYKTRRGRIGALLKFLNWGNRRNEYLYGVRVKGRYIYFKRTCNGKRCAEIGANRPIRQSFKGIMSPDNRRISGIYKGGQNGSRWSAVRI